MIHPVDNSSGQAGGSASKSAGSTSGARFASLHKAAMAAVSADKADSSTTTTDPSGQLDTKLKPPKGETWGPVPGHKDYADILSGPRNGYYVDLAPGPRQGKAFLIERKGGKTYHVYGAGKNKHWIPVPPDPNSLKPPKGETWKPVEHHHDFKQVEGGKRADQFVNLSGNERTGQTFKIEHEHGKTVHVYSDGTRVGVGGHKTN